MDPKEQLLEVQHVLDRLTRFRHLNGWAAVAAGILSIIAYVAINLNFHVPWIKDIVKPEIPISLDAILEYTIYLGSLLVVAVVVCGAIVLISLPNDLTKMAWKNLIKLIAIYAMYIICGGVLLFGLIFNLNTITIGFLQFIPPMMCIFYGMAQLHAAYVSLPALKYLGIWMIICGLAGSIFPAYAWFLWLLAFGFGHIVIGLYVVRDRNH
jgi:hypothetical protein